MCKKYSVAKTNKLVNDILVKAGYTLNRANITSNILTEAELMGHDTHGYVLLDPYLNDALAGNLTMDGSPETVQDYGSAITWNGHYMSGPWLIQEAINTALERIKSYPTVTMVIKKTHHIGCLAAYPAMVTRKNLIMLLACSDPQNRTVAPYGGLKGVYSPNPLAVGIPTNKEPIILDISMSATANGLINKKRNEGEKLPYKWLQDNQGKLTDDPNSFAAESPSTIMPLGGKDLGYKGFGLGLLIEILTSGLAGFGRADEPENWGANVFMQLIDPEYFGGIESFKSQVEHLIKSCLNAESIENNNPIRMPGSKGLALKKERLEAGIPLGDASIACLQRWSKRFNLDFEF